MFFELLTAGRVFRVEPPLGTHCFNGGLVEAWGKLLTVYRVNRRPSLLAISELDEQLTPRYTTILWDLWDPVLNPEDPRVLLSGRELYVTWTGVNSVTLAAAMMCHGALDRDYNVLWKSPCWYQGAGTIEKNWMPFLHDGRLHCIYSYDPLTILRYEAGAWRLVYAREIAWKWGYGPIHGGAPPVWRNGRWYCFFQSSRREGDCKVYYAGCLCLTENWEPLAITTEPILAGSTRKYTEPWGPRGKVSAVFPCGALMRGEGGNWLLSYGYLDTELRIAEIPAAEIDALLGLPGECVQEDSQVIRLAEVCRCGLCEPLIPVGANGRGPQ